MKAKDLLGTPPPLSIPLEGDDEELELLTRKIEREHGFNCQFYKDKCLRGRIGARVCPTATGRIPLESSLLHNHQLSSAPRLMAYTRGQCFSLRR